MFRVVYVTKSQFKAEENAAFLKVAKLSDGRWVRDLFDFQIRKVDVKEILEVDLTAMVMAEVTKAYSEIKVPCIVEHAGLVFEPFSDYPGGLTKPMWNILNDRFLGETQGAGRRAIARAVVAYCDGVAVHTFRGETSGTLAHSPRGRREFYWDTVFEPDGGSGKTYAEIVEDTSLGLEHKMLLFSQSSKAMLAFLEFLLAHPKSELWK